MKNSIQKRTEEYIKHHPSIKDCLKKDIVNYSALARLISKELKIKSIEAISVACRRYQEKIKKDKILEKKSEIF